jgi:protein-S-isoprenylcysteine O-methyltransferase Ste14
MMLLRALLAFLALPGVVAGVLPLLIVGGDFRPGRAAAAGAVLLAAGLFLLLWCVRDFYALGKGTLAPWDPPGRLVVAGLYRFVRNPMYVAVLVLIAGWALVFGSLPLGVYFVLLAVGFHLRVVLAEEPWLRRKHGAQWEEYSREVPRWLPRLRPAGSRGAVKRGPFP